MEKGLLLLDLLGQDHVLGLRLLGREKDRQESLLKVQDLKVHELDLYLGLRPEDRDLDLALMGHEMVQIVGHVEGL